MLYLILFIMILLLLLMVFYVVKKFHQFKFINRIKNKYLSWIVALIPIIIAVIFMFFDMINTLIVLIYLFLFILLFDIIFRFINKFGKHNFSYDLSIILAIIVAFLYLGRAYYLAHHVVETNYTITASKDIGMDTLRIAQISDSHIGATMDGDKFIEYMERINETKPDIVVVTGDFVDDDTTYDDMIKGCLGLGKLKTNYGVYFIYGNHDKGYFNYRKFDDNKLREELKKNNVIILEDESIDITDKITLVGRQDAQVRDRLSALELVTNINDDKYIITLDHEPNDYDNEAKAKMDLVLSGHTHGGQLFPLGYIGLLMGSNDRFYGMETRDSTTFIVNSGIGDWAIKFKTGTIAEYGIIDIKNNK